MSIDSHSECVRSKYFTHQIDMDESLSDFQEAKQSCKGPKPAQKPVKPKARKVTKRIKGQKDIRTVLKGKKNELISYTKEFDTVCRKSGLDVDSDQLQLAIALSKSLQTESDCNSECSPTLSSQQRVAKIRKTLQEYGFKVPNAKITVNKKTKKHRKEYKLLNITAEEKHQNITRKYSQILFENVHHLKLEQNSFNNQDSDARVFNIAANVSYECMKDDNIFYVDNLVEKSVTKGSLLRDWSEIPGRPESPTVIDANIMNFEEIVCSQDELDIILSGSIKSLKEIFTSKQIEYEEKNKECNVPKNMIDNRENIVSDDNTVHVVDKADQENNGIKKKSPFHEGFEAKSSLCEVIEIGSPNKQVEDNNHTDNSIKNEPKGKETSDKLTVIQQYRSCSPDIFDDELSSIMDNTKTINILSQEHKTKVFSQDNFMDFTSCANMPSQGSVKSSQLSQNITKRRSNDFMEVTECIVGSLQPIGREFKEIDLTQSPGDNDAVIDEDHSIIVDDNIVNVSQNLFRNDVEYNPNDSIIQNITDEQNITVLMNYKKTSLHQGSKDNIDLTQSSNDDDKEEVMKYDNHTPDKKKVDSLDFTQSSSSNDIDGLPLVVVASSQTQITLDETIIMSEDEYIANGKVKKSLILPNEGQSQVFDLTQAPDHSLESNRSPVKKTNAESCSNSFYEDFVHDHSENTESSKENVRNYDHNDSSQNETKESNDVDLTQGSDTSEERVMLQRPITVPENIPNNSSLGKRDDVSIDYDDILINDNNENDSFKEIGNDKSVSLKHDSCKSDVNNDIEIIDINYDDDINSSQNSEVFNISDKELDYSLHKSRHEFPRDNFDFGGISILDNVTKLSSFRKSLSEGCESLFASNKNDCEEDSFLPEVNIKKSNNTSTIVIAKTDSRKGHKPEGISPIKFQDTPIKNVCNSNEIIELKTPKNTEYIIKTNDVTPMADYSSMSTPQRNIELDRYGLKPFKRKRAVQILTHIYNQTHPTIQSLEDVPSPSKKPRTHESLAKNLMTSPKKSPSKKAKTSATTPLKTTHETRLHPTPRNFNELERDRDNLSAPCSKKTDELEVVTEVCRYEVSNETAVVKSVDCSPEDWVFQKREKAKVHSCRVPLHIAFHNYVLSRRSLREAILKYEPVNIDVIHKDLVAYGHRYDPKDLLKFLDKKCITVKTTDNNSRNNKR